MMKRFISSVLLIALCLSAGGCASSTKPESDYAWTEKGSYICHALGAIDGFAYTNSKEAFLYNYEKGYRVFEIDTEFTSDGELVLTHGWKNKDLRKIYGIDREKSENKKPISLEEFKNAKVYGRYTTLSLEDFVRIAADYSDIYIVLDGKYGEDEPDKVRTEYQKIYDCFKSYAPHLLDRIIPQIYDEGMLEMINGVYDWKSIIYTWYKFDGDDSFDPIKEMDFAVDNGIKVITMDEDRFRKLEHEGLVKNGLQKKKLMTYVHTINDAALRDSLKERGVYGFYTDELFE